MPNYVHKSGGKGGDQVQVGVWTDGKPGPEGTGTVGTWVQTEGSASVFVDKGQTHASKDFLDGKTGRRILWIWGTVPSGVQAVPREARPKPWNPAAHPSSFQTRRLLTDDLPPGYQADRVRAG